MTHGEISIRLKGFNVNVMMKRMFLATCLLAVVACDMNRLPERSSEPSHFTAVTESNSTKTSLSDDYKVLWNQGDCISVFEGSTGISKYAVSDECAGTTHGTFTLVNEPEDGSSLDANIAIYPYSDNLSCSQYSGSYIISGFVLPEYQTYSADSFPNESFIMAAVTESASQRNLSFKNVLGALELNLTGSMTVSSIRIEGNSGEKLCGSASVSVSAGSNPDITLTGNGTSVTLICGRGIQLSPSKATRFIISLPPVNFSKGFTVTIADMDGSTNVVSTSMQNQVYRSTILTMPELTVPVTDGGNETDPQGNIVFQDTVVKQMCVKAFDTDHDGELSIAEAAAVKDLRLLSSTADFVNFNELKFFTSVKEIPDGLFRNSKLESIILPESIEIIGNHAFDTCWYLKNLELSPNLTDIGDYAFNYCYYLPSIDLPASLRSIGEHAFYYCWNLSSINIPEKVTSLGSHAFAFCNKMTQAVISGSINELGTSAFDNCASLTKVVLPESIKVMGSQAFNLCFNLSEINIPSSLESIGDSAFTSCELITSFDLPVGLTQIGECAFSSCYSLKSIVIPEGVKAVSRAAFSGCKELAEVSLPSSVTMIGDGAFYRCKKLRTVTVPKAVRYIGSDSFSDCESLSELYVMPVSLDTYTEITNNARVKVYVPMESVDLYKQKWGYIASQIVGYNF